MKRPNATRKYHSNNMTESIKQRKEAAESIDQESLQAAKAAVSLSCQEYIRWAQMFSQRLETIESSDLHKFTRALVLTMLGHLPTKPETCPFCIQFGRDQSCKGCSYASIHGRCDSESSSFSRFIEAFQMLGKAVYQDIESRPIKPASGKKILRDFIEVSVHAARQMQEDMPSCTAFRLMEHKASYLDKMVGLLPLAILSSEVKAKCLEVRGRLKDYW